MIYIKRGEPNLPSLFLREVELSFHNNLRERKGILRKLSRVIRTPVLFLELKFFLSTGCVFLGRPFIYGVAALGKFGGDLVNEILLADLHTNLMQMGVKNIAELKKFPYEIV